MVSAGHVLLSDWHSGMQAVPKLSSSQTYHILEYLIIFISVKNYSYIYEAGDLI